MRGVSQLNEYVISLYKITRGHFRPLVSYFCIFNLELAEFYGSIWAVVVVKWSACLPPTLTI